MRVEVSVASRFWVRRLTSVAIALVLLAIAVVIFQRFNKFRTPVARVDSDEVVGDEVELNGSGSSDQDGDSLSYSWTQVEGPTGVTLQGAGSVKARFTPTRPGLYRFRLVVNDGTVASAPDEVRITVIHELAHHTSGAEDLEERHSAHMTLIAGHVVHLTHLGRFDELMKEVTW